MVHDFRANDIAAGGAGAPLVPYVDARLLGGRGEAVLAVNIGGIANLHRAAGARRRSRRGARHGLRARQHGARSAARRGSRAGAQSADIDGRLAARGRVRPDLLTDLRAHPFFAAAPPKSAGREQFGAAFVDALLAKAPPADEQDWCDLLATATELTALGIHDCYLRHVAPGLPVDAVAISGGGARNPQLMARLAARFGPIPVRTSDAYGLPVDAKEAIAFAILASERLDERPANVPSVTGALPPRTARQDHRVLRSRVGGRSARSRRIPGSSADRSARSSGASLGRLRSAASWRASMAVISAHKRVAALGEPDPHHPAVVARALLLDEARVDQPLEIVGDVRAEIVAAGHQLADADLLVADVGQQQALDVVDLIDAEAFQLDPQHVEEAPVQALDQGDGLGVSAGRQASDPVTAAARLRPRLAAT